MIHSLSFRPMVLVGLLPWLCLGCGSEVVVFGNAGGNGGSGGGAGGSAGNGGSTCVPGMEICDGFDNDCNGQVDEGCNCQAGQAQPCYTGDPSTLGVGPCTGGTQTCNSSGQWGPCVGEITPTTETCNLVDDNCNGQVDDGLAGATCMTGLPGICATGTQQCQNGMSTCVPNQTPQTEICDGLDNNCNSQTDESDPNVGMFCNTGQPGVCAWGTFQCQASALICVAQQAPSPEVCDNQDNDCDNLIDDGLVGAPCMTGMQGPCAMGTQTCQNGMFSCVPNQVPQLEVCDGIDNDCNGQVDAQPCGCGGSATCINGNLVCNGGSTIYFEETFANNNAGWTLDMTWEIGPSSSAGGPFFGSPDPAFDHTLTADNGVAGVVLGGNTPTTLHPFYYLTSPIISTNVAGNVFLQYWRWLNSDYTPWMQNHVQVFDGMTWVTLWQSGPAPGIQDNAWQKASFDITAYKNPNLRIRFGYDVATQGAFTVSSWNVDDVLVTSAACP